MKMRLMEYKLLPSPIAQKPTSAVRAFSVSHFGSSGADHIFYIRSRLGINTYIADLPAGYPPEIGEWLATLSSIRRTPSAKVLTHLSFSYALLTAWL